MTVVSTVRLTEEQHAFIRQKEICVAKFVRQALNDAIEEDKRKKQERETKNEQK